jgi:shikimate dehydrogenase
MPAGAPFLSTITGSFSTPAGDNPTVAMVEAAYRHHGVDARYLNCEVPVERLGDAVRGAVAMGWVGFNCSLPHKVAVIAHLDRLAPSAEIIGAANCVVRRDGELVGENTDGQGFLAALRTVVDPAGRSIALFGAGGAARAIAVEAALGGAAHVTVINRDPGRGQELVALIRDRTPAAADLLVWDGPARLPEDEQGVIGIRHWTGVDPDTSVMRRALEAALHL